MKIRGDLSHQLIHLTHGRTSVAAKANFESILKSRELRGGTGYIRGNYKCVCFNEAPISVLSQTLGDVYMRYAPLGVMVSKVWLFQQGGRPVIYQSDGEFDLLPEDLRYRHVRYEPDNGIDFTWEREWRIKTDVLTLDVEETTFVVPSRAWEDRFRTEGFTDLHFLVLDDLGMKVDWWEGYK